MRHACEGRGEVEGSNYDQGGGDWEANFNNIGREEVERPKARRRPLFVERREDREGKRDCGRNAQDKWSAKDEGIVEDGGALRKKVFLCNGHTSNRPSAKNVLQRFKNDSNYC